MFIIEYFKKVEDILEKYKPFLSYEINYDKRDEHIGFIKGIVHFIDLSELHIREFVNVEVRVERIIYAYQYMKDKKLIFRYDNASDTKAKNLSTFPHHKHINSDNVIESKSPTLEKVLDEIIEKITIFMQKQKNYSKKL